MTTRIDQSGLSASTSRTTFPFAIFIFCTGLEEGDRGGEREREREADRIRERGREKGGGGKLRQRAQYTTEDSRKIILHSLRMVQKKHGLRKKHVCISSSVRIK